MAVANLLTLIEPVMIVFLGRHRRRHRHRDVPAAVRPDQQAELTAARGRCPAAAPGGDGLDAVEQRLKRLMLVRVVMITTLLLIAIYVEAVSETLLRREPALLPDRRDLRAHPRLRGGPALRCPTGRRQVVRAGHPRPARHHRARLPDRRRAAPRRLHAALPDLGPLRQRAPLPAPGRWSWPALATLFYAAHAVRRCATGWIPRAGPGRRPVHAGRARSSTRCS